MSAIVSDVNLNGASVGQTGTIYLDKFVSQAPTLRNNPPYIRFYNESQCGLSITLDTGAQEIVPAGAWYTHDAIGVNSATWTVLYVMTNPLVTHLYTVYYPPGEQLPDLPNLGNSPIGGTSGTATTTLSQEGQPKTLLTIDIGDTSLAQLITINNDGTSTWKVDVSGVAHTIFTIASTANFLKLGQAGDTLETLGQLTVDQLLNVVPDSGHTPSANGSVGGSITCYPLATGTIKLYAVYWNLFSSTVTKTLTLPVAFTQGIFAGIAISIGVGGNGGCQVISSGTAQTVKVLTTLPTSGTTAGVFSTGSSIYEGWIFGIYNQAIDSITALTNTGAHSGAVFLIGI